MKITSSGAIVNEPPRGNVPPHEWRPTIPAHTESGALLIPQSDAEKENTDAKTDAAKD